MTKLDAGTGGSIEALGEWLAHKPFCGVMGQDSRHGWREGDELICNCGLAALLTRRDQPEQEWQQRMHILVAETRRCIDTEGKLLNAYRKLDALDELIRAATRRDAPQEQTNERVTNSGSPEDSRRPSENQGSAWDTDFMDGAVGEQSDPHRRSEQTAQATRGQISVGRDADPAKEPQSLSNASNIQLVEVLCNLMDQLTHDVTQISEGLLELKALMNPAPPVAAKEPTE